MAPLEDFGKVAGAYAVSLVIGALVALVAVGDASLWSLFVFDSVATVVLFGIATWFKNSSFYDPYWSVLPPILAAPMLAWADDAVLYRQVIVLMLIWAWAIRLTWNWARGWSSIEHEDWRYVQLRKDSGVFWPVVNFAGIMYFPTLLVFGGCLALWPALVTGGRGLGVIDLVALIVTLGAIVIETLADEQLRQFRARRRSPDAILDEGLWRWSRHPNYFGELAFWWGLWLFGVAANPSDWWWTLIGPLAMTGLFAGISIPLIERRMVAKRPHYKDIQATTSALIPLPRRPL